MARRMVRTGGDDMQTSNTRHLPTSIWVLGFVSFLMDVSSEMIHSLLPLFLADPLGVSAIAIGFLEGMAEGIALLLKVVSGILSDFIGRRKPLAVVGYALGALTKPLFAIANGFGMVFLARIVDRVGKGIRGAPRDALIAEITSFETRGAAFGLRQGLDSLGAFVGPLLAFVLMLMWAGDFRRVFWLAVFPGALCVLLLVLYVHEPTASTRPSKNKLFVRSQIRTLGKPFAQVLIMGALFGTARFSEAFLLLHAHTCGISVVYVPLVLAALNLVYGVTAYPFGRRSDHTHHNYLLAAGVIPLLIADIVLALATGPALLFAGVALWGLHMGMTQGLLSRMVADASLANVRGTAFGLFHLTMGVTAFIGNLIAGILWTVFGAMTLFMFGALLSLLLLLLIIMNRNSVQNISCQGL